MRKLPNVNQTARTLGYRRYGGGTGPTVKQQQKNNEALAAFLRRRRVKAVVKPARNREEREQGFTFVQVGRRSVYYDRWGFSTLDKPVFALDNNSFGCAVQYLIGLRRGQQVRFSDGGPRLRTGVVVDPGGHGVYQLVMIAWGKGNEAWVEPSDVEVVSA
jgi:hypothetical protein